MAVHTLQLHHLSIPLKGPFHTGAGGIDAREIVLAECHIDDDAGWGEAAPYPGQDEPFETVLSGIQGGPIPATLASAVECAIADARARVRGISLASEVGAERETVPASIAVPLGGDPAGTVSRAVAEGVTRFKIKIAPGHVDHVAPIVEAHAGVVMGVDANGSFDASTVGDLAALSGLPIVYFEQPCDPADMQVLERIRGLMDIPIFVDETVRTVADARAVLNSPFIDGVVVKPGRLGLAGSLEAIGEAQRVGKRWRSSGLLESGIGRAYSDLIAAIPSAFVSDVAPADWFLERDVVPNRFDAGEVRIPGGPGIGLKPDRDVIDRYRIASFEGADLFRRLGVPTLD